MKRQQHIDRRLEEAKEASSKALSHYETIQKQIEVLQTEIAFEDTLAGEIESLEEKAFEKLEKIVNKLQDATGMIYTFNITARDPDDYDIKLRTWEGGV